MSIQSRNYRSPLGWLELSAANGELLTIKFVKTPRSNANARARVLEEACLQLDAYFSGNRRHFSVPFRLEGSEFEKSVWKELTQTEYGKLTTYSELAKHLGSPRAARAVGNALGKNRLPIIIPCHRVVSRNSLGGFTGGLEIKRFLLQLEGITTFEKDNVPPIRRLSGQFLRSFSSPT